MLILIENNKNLNILPFIHVRIFPMIYSLVLKNIDKDIFDLYDTLLKTCIQRILFDRNYLYCYKLHNNNVVIAIESNKIVGENSAKLCDICGIVNYGSLDYPATGVFTKVFNYIQENFWYMYTCYKLEVSR